MKLLDVKDTKGLTFSSVCPDVYTKFQETGDKDVFEMVLDALMLEKYSDNIELKNYINNLPNNNKRSAILSLIGDDNVLWGKINDILKSDKSSYQYLKEIILLLRDYVKIADVERKKHGEILTPFEELAKPMINLLDKYDIEFWKNPNHKVLDSSAGYGTFLILAAYKFMEGLKDWEPNEEKRFKHIVENCLYYGELQAKSVFSWLVVIDPHNKYKTNTYWGSFLNEEFDNHAKNVWNVKKWDLIIQNPPYNSGAGGNGGREIWDKFVLKCLKIFNDDGYMIFVHPSRWRSPDNKILTEFKNYDLKYLEIHSKKDGKKIFNATTRYDIYVLKNSNYNGLTIIIDEKNLENKIDIRNWSWIPNYNFNNIFNIIDNKNNCDVIYSRSLYGNDKKHMSDKKNNFPCIYGMYKDGTFTVKYSSSNKGHFDVKKVILGLGEKLYPLVDDIGKYGIMNNAFGLIIKNKEEGLKIKKAIESDRFKEIIKATKWSNFQTDYKMFKYFKKDFWKEFI